MTAIRLAVFTLGAAVIATMFLVVPLMVVFGPWLTGTVNELTMALATIVLVEIPVVAILLRTTSVPTPAPAPPLAPPPAPPPAPTPAPEPVPVSRGYDGPEVYAFLGDLYECYGED